jgi:membrane protein implicated in regulation of membrane protease activity
LALGVSAAAIPLASYIHLTTGGFYWLFVILAVLAGIAAIATWFLPRPKADKDALLVSELSAKSSLG